MVEYSEEERWEVVTFYKHGLSNAEIKSKTKKSYDFIRETIKRYKETGGVKSRSRSGRPKICSPQEEKKIERMTRGKIFKSVRTTHLTFKTKENKVISQSTIYRIFKNRGLKAKKRPKKPLRTKEHKKKRLAFAKKFKNMDWTKVLFSDEKYFVKCAIPSSRNNFVWVKEGDKVLGHQVVKHSPTVFVWAGMCINGTTSLHVIEGNMNSEKYQEVLEKTMIPETKRLLGVDFVFQQDGARPHTSKSTVAFLESNGINFIAPNDWPPNSPDLNPIENLWGIIDERVKQRRFRSFQGFKKCVIQEWKKIEPELLQNLIISMQKRLKNVIENKGE